MDLARPAAAGLARLCLRPDLCRSGLGLPRGPVSRHSSRSGQSGPREDRRGSPRFAWFAALCRALWSGIRRTGFGWGRAGMRYAAERREYPTPPPNRARVVTLAHAHRSNPPSTADFQRRLSVRAFPGHFSSSFRRSGPLKGPRACISSKKWHQKALQGRRQLVPSLFAMRKSRDHLLSAACLPGADS